MEHKAIPTTYNGIRFRSRLEAKWAAFFDLCDWKWEYEPEDLNGYIPDFVLIGKKGLLYVEVKPFYTEDQWQKIVPKIDSAFKEENIDEQPEFLFLGATTFDSEYHGDGLSLGFLYSLGTGLDEAVLNYYEKTPGIIAGWGGYQDRITGLYDGDAYVHVLDKEVAQQVIRKAQNKVQWQP